MGESFGCAGVISPGRRIGGALALVVALMIGSGTAAWRWQSNSYGKQLADQARLHGDELAAISNAAAAQGRADRDKRLALEQRLSASEKFHYKELSDAQENQARLRDRLASPSRRHGFSQWLLSANRHLRRRRGSWWSTRPT
jgi:hypothetical protein